MEKLTSTLLCLFSCFYLCATSSSSQVPLILWNIKGSALRFQPVSVFDDGTKNSAPEIFDEIFNYDSPGLVVFLLEKLSMEDLAPLPDSDKNNSVRVLQTFLDQHPHRMHSNVKDPVKYLEKTACGVDNIYVTPSMAGRIDKAIPAALKHSCVVFVHLPYNSFTSEGKSIFESDDFIPKLHKILNNVVGVFTSKQSSWESGLNALRKTRSLLAVDDTEMSNFINASCFIMYAENITVVIGKVNNETAMLSFPPKAESSCGNSSQLTLTFGESGPFTSVTIMFRVDNLASAWKVSGVSTIIAGKGAPEGDIPLRVDMEAPHLFSYSCGRLSLHSDNSTPEIEIKFEGFQIQSGENVEKFYRSFDCVSWFTVPIWMGTFVVLLFLTILQFGVYFLYEAKTMDRFDDPKGKTISVPQTE